MIISSNTECLVEVELSVFGSNLSEVFSKRNWFQFTASDSKPLNYMCLIGTGIAGETRADGDGVMHPNVILSSPGFTAANSGVDKWLRNHLRPLDPNAPELLAQMQPLKGLAC